MIAKTWIRKLLSILPQRRCVAVFRADGPPQDVSLAGEPCSDPSVWQEASAHDPHLRLVAQVAPHRWARGDRAWCFFEQGELVHVAWTRHDDVLDLTYELGPGSCWRLPPASTVIYDCYTLAQARGRGVYPRALRWLRRLRPGPCWIYCACDNVASQRGIERAGFMPVAVLRRWYGAKRFWGHRPEWQSGESTHEEFPHP